MVIKFATFDPAQGPDDFNPAFPPSPSSSPSATLCQPCEYTCTFTRAIVGRLVAAGASLVLRAPALEIDGHEIRDRSTETLLHSINSNVRPEFHRRQPKEFTLKELEVATQNFSHRNIIGRGGFGKVYKGQLADGTLVAIKRLKEERTQGLLLQFETEVIIGSIEPPHHNLLPMLGYCRASVYLLVYPFMINLSLASCLRERNDNQPPLDWPTRGKIATGAARGLSHLHDLNILHRDIKAANILLDEKFEPHIADFGLALFVNRRQGGYSPDFIMEAPVLPSTEARSDSEDSVEPHTGDFGLALFINRRQGGYSADFIEEAPVLLSSEVRSDSKYSVVTTAIRGTIGHIAPEYVSTGKCSVKNDVFGFGIMLLELLSGQRAYDLARLAYDHAVMLLDWVKELLAEHRWEILVDPDLPGAYDEEEIEKVIQLALLCTQSDPRERPSMAQVLQILEGHSIEELELRSRPCERRYIHNPHTDWIVADSTSRSRNQERYIHNPHTDWIVADSTSRSRDRERYIHSPHTDWIVADSTSHLRPDELSGPR